MFYKSWAACVCHLLPEACLTAALTLCPELPRIHRCQPLFPEHGMDGQVPPPPLPRPPTPSRALGVGSRTRLAIRGGLGACPSP